MRFTFFIRLLGSVIWRWSLGFLSLDDFWIASNRVTTVVVLQPLRLVVQLTPLESLRPDVSVRLPTGWGLGLRLWFRLSEHPYDGHQRNPSFSSVLVSSPRGHRRLERERKEWSSREGVEGSTSRRRSTGRLSFGSGSRRLPPQTDRARGRTVVRLVNPSWQDCRLVLRSETRCH